MKLNQDDPLDGNHELPSFPIIDTTLVQGQEPFRVREMRRLPADAKVRSVPSAKEKIKPLSTSSKQTVGDVSGNSQIKEKIKPRSEIKTVARYSTEKPREQIRGASNTLTNDRPSEKMKVKKLYEDKSFERKVDALPEVHSKITSKVDALPEVHSKITNGETKSVKGAQASSSVGQVKQATPLDSMTGATVCVTLPDDDGYMMAEEAPSISSSDQVRDPEVAERPIAMVRPASSQPDVAPQADSRRHGAQQANAPASKKARTACHGSGGNWPARKQPAVRKRQNPMAPIKISKTTASATPGSAADHLGASVGTGEHRPAGVAAEEPANQQASLARQEERDTVAREEAAAKAWEGAATKGGLDASTSPARETDSPPASPPQEGRTKRLHDMDRREEADARAGVAGSSQAADQDTVNAHGLAAGQTAKANTSLAADREVATASRWAAVDAAGGESQQPEAKATCEDRDAIIISSASANALEGSSRPRLATSVSSVGSVSRLQREWANIGESSGVAIASEHAILDYPATTNAFIPEYRDGLKVYAKVALAKLLRVDQSVQADNKKRTSLFNQALTQFKAVKAQYLDLQGRFQAQEEELRQARAGAADPTEVRDLRIRLARAGQQRDLVAAERDQLQEQSGRLASREEELNRKLQRLTVEKDKQVADHQAELERLAKEHRREAAENGEQLGRLASREEELDRKLQRLAAEKDKQVADHQAELKRLTGEHLREAAEQGKQLGRLASREQELDRKLQRLAAEKDKQVADHQAELERLAEERRREAAENGKQLGKTAQALTQLRIEYNQLEWVTPLPGSLTVLESKMLEHAREIDALLAKSFPDTQGVAVAAVEEHRKKQRARVVHIGEHDAWTTEEIALAAKARRLPVVGRLLHRLRVEGADLLGNLWPNRRFYPTDARWARWLEMAKFRMDTWRDSAARTGAELTLRLVLSWYPEVDLGHLAELGSKGADADEDEDLSDIISVRASDIASSIFFHKFVKKRAEDGTEIPDTFGLDDDESSDEDGREIPEDTFGLYDRDSQPDDSDEDCYADFFLGKTKLYNLTVLGQITRNTNRHLGRYIRVPHNTFIRHTRTPNLGKLMRYRVGLPATQLHLLF